MTDVTAGGTPTLVSSSSFLDLSAFIWDRTCSRTEENSLRTSWFFVQSAVFISFKTAWVQSLNSVMELWKFDELSARYCLIFSSSRSRLSTQLLTDSYSCAIRNCLRISSATSCGNALAKSFVINVVISS